MDPAMPDWRAFGQPAPAAAAEPGGPAARSSLPDWLTRLPRGTLVALALAAALAVGGLGLALVSPAGGDVTLIATPGDQPVQLAAGTARSVVDGPAVDGPRGPSPTAVPHLVIDVAGAVARPGLVRLPPGSRVGDAVAAAGGFAPTADLAGAAAALNLAAPLADGEKVLVPVLGVTPVADVASAGTASDGAGPRGGRVDLNRASQAELEELPGIGPVTAGRILEARSEAPFSAVDELRSRGLVGESTFGKLRDLVSVGP